MRALLIIGVLAALSTPATAQTGPQLIVTMRVAGTIQDTGGAYYVAFTVGESLLAGPQPDSTDWTHYVVHRGGRFFFGTVPPTAIRQPFGFVAIRPPAPFIFGQVLPDRQTLRISVPLTMLGIGPSADSRVSINFVTVDDQHRLLDALGPGANDRFGYVTITVRRDPFTTIRDPRGDCPDLNFDIVGGEIQIGTP